MDGVAYVEVPVSPTAEKANMKVYRRRWIVLAVFFYFSMVNSFHWVQYTIVGDPVARYYGILATQVNWTSYVFMGALVVLMVPACFVIDKRGMRWSLMFGGLLMMMGAWFKVAAVSPDRFLVVLLGQVAVGVAQLFMLGTPAKVAAIWFHADELSFACAVAVFGNQLGLGLGFLVPPMVVRPHDDPLDIGRDLKLMTYITAANSTLVAVLVVLLFKEKPELPPSPTQALERSSQSPVTFKSFVAGLRNLLANTNYQLMCACNGIANGSLNVFVTMLNPVILRHFPDGQEFAGRVGVVIIVVGLLGCIIFGILLDKTHKYKEFTLGVYALMAVATAVFGFVLKTINPTYVYLSAGVLGLFLIGFMPIAFEMSAELTYPESVSTMGNLLFIPSNILGILMTILFSEIFQRWSDLHAILFVCASLVVGTILSFSIQRDYRRLLANRCDAKDLGQDQKYQNGITPKKEEI